MFRTNIEEDTLSNNYFRKVIFTGQHMQLVLMSLKPGEEIGEEIHETVDQFFRFEEGKGTVYANDETYEVAEDDVVIIPAGTKHNIVNTGSEDLKLYTIYAPPNHPDGTINKDKMEALEYEKAHH